MDAKFRLRERLVGLFLVITLVLSVGGIIAVGRGKNWFSKHNIYFTTFKEGYGLQEGSTVKMFNTEIGRVRSIKINDDNEVEVSVSILADYAGKIKRDSVATVESPTLIGSEYISITPGSRTAALVPPQGRISSTPRKSIASYMDDLDLKERLGEVSHVVTAVTKMATELTGLVAEMRRSDGPFMGTLTDVKAMTGQVRAGKGTAGKLITDDSLYVKLDQLSAELKQTAATLNQVATNVKPASAELPALMKELAQSVKSMKATIDNFRRGAEDFPALVTNTDESVRQFRRVVESAKTLPLLRSNLPPDQRRDEIGLDPRGM
jgi:phospholipid/cholesterol/gamma-HCH transport system substrate-binding protein